MPGCRSASTTAAKISAGSRNWPEPGSASIRRHRMWPSTIWSENRWFSVSSACLRRPRAVDTYPLRHGRARPGHPRFRTKTSMPGEPFYITTAIAYPNGPPHIGHAYEAIATDAIARFQRLDGFDVFFLTGTDEHGLKMKQTALKEGLTPRALADRNSALFRAMA